MSVALKVVKTQAEEDYASRVGNQPDNDNLPERVLALRKEAASQFVELGLPHRRVEEWKYTDLRNWLSELYKPAERAEHLPDEAGLNKALGALSTLDCYKITFVNGHWVSELSDHAAAGEAIKALPIKKGLNGQWGWLENEFAQVNPPEKPESVLAANTALFADGAAVEITQSLDKPLQLIFLNTAETPQSVHVRNFLRLHEGVSADVLETHVGLGQAPTQSNFVTEVKIADNAELRHLKLNDDENAETHLSTTMGELGASSNYKVEQLTFAGRFARSQYFVKFAGEHSNFKFSGGALLKDKQHADTTMVVDHAVPHCTSRELFKVVLDDEARGVFQGKVIVRPHAQKTDGEQMSNALLLSDDAEFDAKPELEIFADDVVCGHGATSGQIDEELLFYLRSRGIPQHEARSLLIAAFMGEVVEQIEDENIREPMSKRVLQWFGERERKTSAA